ncbi:HAD family phosphatase [Altererythrobacter arenosus]|uniref:HAD family phosphatase n=1 Tax=Altererythrobacter arenosus TaxID=3032592 RepID=A0ABY8FW32_9SPHN|nr:HAD family phosphatase [Altererythrobacter sp. CAU 1644]WFL78445.1 HAD family phosphatase [Altererythrobacter sp. CAU 1644]
MPIRNIVFDIGNVVVPWDPHAIVRDALGDERVDQPGFRSPFARSETWIAVNRGEHSLEEAKPLFIERHGLADDEVDRLYQALFDSMVLLEGTVPLMRDLAAAGHRLFALTDNVREIVAHLRRRYDFWDLFEHAAVSAEIGVLKPDPRIYQHLIDAGSLDPQETLFFDDLPRNVAGAEAVGMIGRVFTTAQAARCDLAQLDVIM